MTIMERPPVRQRVPRVASFFDPAINTSTERAFFDQIRVRFSRYLVVYREWDVLREYVRQLGTTPLFRSNVRNNSVFLHVRRGWLFGGTLRFHPHQVTGQRLANVLIELRLNPTRFLAHRSLPLEQLHDMEPEIILREDTQAYERLTRATLDQQDNIILSDPTRTYSRATDILNLYLDKVTTLIDQTLRQYADEEPPVFQPDIRVIPDWSGFVVPRAEVYWEFSSEEASDCVYRLQPHLNAIASEARTSEYPVDHDPEGATPARSHVRRNAVAVEVSLGTRHASLLVYAKAHRRVRFEVRYSRLRNALGRQAARSLIGEQLDDLPRLLQVAAETANRRLQRVRAALSDVDVLVDPGLAQLLRLASRLAMAAGDNEDLADRIFSCLATTGGISSSSDPDWQQAIEALEQMGIIVRRLTALRSNHRRYALSQAYGSTVRAVAHAIRSAPTSEVF